MPQSLYSLFTPQRQQAVFKELEQLFTFLTDEKHHKRFPSSSNRLPGGSHSSLDEYLKCRQSGRRHIEIPLQYLSTSTSATTALRSQLPSGTLQFFDQLYVTAFQYLKELLGVIALSPVYPHMVDRRLWEWPPLTLREGLERQSVFRLLQYPEGVGCRPHYDPGLCSALLLGSADGLEIAQPLLGCYPPPTGNMSPRCSCDGVRKGENTGGGPMEPLARGYMGVTLPVLPANPDPSTFQWVAASSLCAAAEKSSADVVVLQNYHLERITNGYCSAVWHRVQPTWSSPDSQRRESRYRYNIVVELRLPPCM